jgi:CheY-like chemotaxis protein
VRVRIFEPLFTTKTVDRGTGMGLAMVHSIVHRANGHISLDSTVGEGTLFEVHFPVAADVVTAHAAPVACAATMNEIRAARVLVVDDEIAVARFIAEVLELDGHHAQVCSDPVTALETFCTAPDAYDLVISDQTMPGLTGAQLAARVLALRPALPVLLLSGHSATLTAASARELGARALLAKPIDIETLQSAVRAALG